MALLHKSESRATQSPYLLRLIIPLIIMTIIIEKIPAMPTYGQDARVICRPYVTYILLETYVVKIPEKWLTNCYLTTVFLAVKCISLTIC